MPIQVPVTQTGLEASIQAAAQKAGRNLKIDLGVSSRSIGALSQPLGKITGQADQFTKSMEAANARVLAFGASVGVLSAVAQGFSQLVTVTIQVEKNMADINSVLQTNSANLNKFKNDIFSVAKETGNSFQTVSDAALELSRQGLKSDEVLRRLKDSMILSRLSGLDAASAVEGLTAAVNSFSKEGVTTSDVLNKISKTAAAFSVSERDLIEGFKRSASVAQQAGVSLDELGGIITAVQQKTARGGAVIGNAFKTIFTRIQRPDSLAALQDIGAAVTDAQGGILPATKLIENLAVKMKGLNDIQVANITEKIGGGFQVGPLIAALDDITSKTSTFKGATEAMATAGGEAYKRNTALNQTLAASINMATVNLQELANTLGEIGVTDSLKNILSFFNSFATNVKDVLQGEGLGSDFAKGLVKGISAVLSGPGLLLFGAIIAKLAINFVQFGAVALKTFFNIGSAAKEIGAIQSTIASTLLNNKSIQTQILALEGNRVAQAQFFSTALNTQLATMEKMRTIAASIAPVVYGATTGAGKPRAAGGYMPTVMAEANDISKGVGGAKSSDRPVIVPNFAFGGGKTGTMVANTGEHIVPNYNGGSGSAIFNRDMVGRMGLPNGAQKIGAAGGFIPNFAAAPKDFGKYLSSQNKKPEDILGTLGKPAPRKAGNLDKVWRDDVGGLRASYESLSETDRRNLNVQSKQQSQEKNISQKSGKYGFIYPDALGSSIVQNYNTPAGNVVKGIPIQTKPSDYLYKEIRDGLVNSSLKYASNLGFNPDIVNEQNFKNLIDKNLNPGSIESAYGTVFESAFQASIGSDQKSNTSWDLPNKDSISSLIGKMKSTGVLGSASAGGQALASVSVADFKNALHLDNLKSIDAKVAYTMGKKASKGYIPNFADPLNEAISREIGAGVNPSQVYIDQNNSLKGPMNPSGLMVANRRDEPSGGWQGINRARKEGANAKTYGAANGFVPNYVNYGPGTVVGSSGTSSGVAAARPMAELANSAEEVTKGNRDMLGTIFAVQAGLSLLVGSTSDATSGLGKFANSLSSVASTATSVLFAGQGLKSLAKEGGAASAVLGKVGIYGAVAAGAFEAFKQVGSYLDSTNLSITKASGAMEKVAKAAENASVSLGKFRPSEVKEIQKQRGALISGALRTGIKSQQFEASGMGGGRMVEKEAVATFEGFTDEMETEFNAMVDTALGAGVSYGKIWNMINENSKTGAKITAEEVEKMAKEIEGLTEIAAKFKPDDVIKKFKLSPEEGLGQKLIGATPERLEKLLKGDSKISEFLSGKGIAEGEGQKKALELVQDLLKTSLDTKTEESSKAVEALNIEYEKTLEILKSEVNLRELNLQIDKEISGKGGAKLEAERQLLEVSRDINLSDVERANKIEDINKGLDNQLKKLDLQKSSAKDLQGTFAKLFSGIGVEDPSKQANDLFAKINKIASTQATEIGQGLLIGNEKPFESYLNGLGLAQSTTDAIKSTLAEWFKNLTLSTAELQKQEGYEAGLSDAVRERLALEKTNTDNLAKRNELLQNSIQLNQQLKDLQIKEFTPEEFAKRKQVVELGKPKLNETSLEALKREAQKARLERELQPIDLSRSIQEIQQSSLQTGIGQLTSIATKGAADATEVAKITEEISKATDLEQLRGQYNGEFNENLDKIIAKRNEEIDQLKEGNALQEQGLSLAEQKLKAIQSGVFGGLESGLAKLREENEMFAFNLGERIPSLFADNMAAAMEAVIVKGEDLGDSLRSAASSFLSEITKANIKNLASQFTTGGGTLFRAKGGPITGGSGNKDDVPAMLMGGEYVMNKRAVSKYGTGFMEALNNGSVSGFADGGSVIRSRGIATDVINSSNIVDQTGEGGFQMPGYYGSGAITGKKDLLSYASQAYTSGAGDIIGGGDNSAYIDITPESVRLTNFGRNQGPMAAAVRESKEQSLDLYFQQLAAEKQAKEEEKAQKKAFKRAIITALITSAVGAVVGAGAAGFKAGVAGAGPDAGFMGSLGAGAKGVFTGGDIGGGVMAGGLKNLFSGNYQLSQISDLKGYSQYLNKNPEEISKFLAGSASKSITGAGGGTLNAWSGDAMGPDGMPTFNLPIVGEPDYNDMVLPPRVTGFATGGRIPQTSGIDTVPAMLSGGEFIMNAGATQRIGASNLNAMNSGASTETSSSAINDQLISKLDELIKITKESSKPVTVNVSSQQGQAGGDNQGEENKSEKDQNLSRKIKAAVIAVLQEEKRLGGVLRRS